MEVSGNNRYDILDMENELDAGIATIKNYAETATKKNDQSTQHISKNIRENKLHILNKHNGHLKLKNEASGHKSNSVKTISNQMKDSSKRPNGRMSSSENYHSNITEYNNELPQRQTRDRDIKAPLRFRVNEKFGKREFDRQSGSDKTGIKSVDKRDGAGAHNWGSAKQDIEALKAGDTAPITDKEDSAVEMSGDLLTNLEEESKQMTLDEWKALKDQRAKPNYNLRKAGEGEGNSEWKKMTILCKKKELDIEDELEYDPSMYPQRIGRLQRIVDIQFNFNDGRKHGFRKGPRVSARGSYREDVTSSNGFEKLASSKFGEKLYSGSKALKVDDENQFPTLS